MFFSPLVQLILSYFRKICKNKSPLLYAFPVFFSAFPIILLIKHQNAVDVFSILLNDPEFVKLFSEITVEHQTYFFFQGDILNLLENSNFQKLFTPA
jgi:hypothetical protein